jgi:hypothetical protein
LRCGSGGRSWLFSEEAVKRIIAPSRDANAALPQGINRNNIGLCRPRRMEDQGEAVDEVEKNKENPDE